MLECAPRMKPIAIVVTGDPVPEAQARQGSFAEMIRRHAGAGGEPFVEVDLRGGAQLPAPGALAGVIVTGSAASVTERAEWTLRGEELLRQLVAAEVPVFGICYGHQMLGQALGGLVQKNPRGREIGTVTVRQSQADPVLGDAGSYTVNTTHVDSVVELPPRVTPLAHSDLEPHAAVRFGAQAWGVQFHPEFDADVMRGYLQARREVLAAEGLDPEALLAAVSDTPQVAAMLGRFVQHARGRR